MFKPLPYFLRRKKILSSFVVCTVNSDFQFPFYLHSWKAEIKWQITNREHTVSTQLLGVIDPTLAYLELICTRPPCAAVQVWYLWKICYELFSFWAPYTTKTTGSYLGSGCGSAVSFFLIFKWSKHFLKKLNQRRE